MDISASMGMVDDPSDPEELSISDSDSSNNRSSVGTNPDNGLDIGCELVAKFNQGIGPWLFEVLTHAFRHGEGNVASVQSYLVKREEIQARDNSKKSLRKAMKDENHILNVMFELPKIFHPHGHVTPDYRKFLECCFAAEDMRPYTNTNNVTELPTNRAWILLIRDLRVNAKYQRLGIGGNMIRKTIQRVMEECAGAGRPLLVAVQPKRIDEFMDEEWSEIREMVYGHRVNELFWENIGFKHFQGPFSGFVASWYFWGSAFRLPPKKSITIPDDLESRKTRTATPPPRAHSPRNWGKPNPYHWFPVVEGSRVRSRLRLEETELRTLLPAPPRDDSAPRNDAADRVQWLNDPDDPSLDPEDAQLLRDLIRTLDTAGKEYRVRPLKEPVQASAVQSASHQPKCPFKAPSGATAPRAINISSTLPLDPPTLRSSRCVVTANRNLLPARRSLRNQVSSAQPGSRFLVSSSEDGDDGEDPSLDDSDVTQVDLDELENCSYEELVALGFIHADEDSSDEEL